MAGLNPRCYNHAVNITCAGPYDFPLSWRFMASFGEGGPGEPAISMWWGDIPTLVMIEQLEVNPPTIQLRVEPKPTQPRRLEERMGKVLNADLGLEPFYGRARRDETLGPIVRRLNGLKPLRPPDLFQMMVTAITEQQISLAAAFSIRARVVERYGAKVGELPIFPRPADMAPLSVEELRGCGLSGRKAEYIINLARMMEDGLIDPQDWADIPDDDLISLISSYRGFGEWTAEYILLRGLGRMDVVPAADVGIRRLVGSYLAGGSRPSAADVRSLLEPWAPWRGLVAFYFMADYRLTHMGLDQAQ